MSPTGDPTTCLSPAVPKRPTLLRPLPQQDASAVSRLRPSALAVTQGAGLAPDTGPSANASLPEGVAAQVPAGWGPVTAREHLSGPVLPRTRAMHLSPRRRCGSRLIPRTHSGRSVNGCVPAAPTTEAATEARSGRAPPSRERQATGEAGAEAPGGSARLEAGTRGAVTSWWGGATLWRGGALQVSYGDCPIKGGAEPPSGREGPASRWAQGLRLVVD